MFDLVGYEPLIRATPLDVSGDPISITDAMVGEVGQGYAMAL